MPYLETAQELLDDGAPPGTSLQLFQQNIYQIVEGIIGMENLISEKTSFGKQNVSSGFCSSKQTKLKRGRFGMKHAEILSIYRGCEV